VSRVQDWPYSSFHRDVRARIFTLDWAGDVDVVASSESVCKNARGSFASSADPAGYV
jgi:putative transposase